MYNKLNIINILITGLAWEWQWGANAWKLQGDFCQTTPSYCPKVKHSKFRGKFCCVADLWMSWTKGGQSQSTGKVCSEMRKATKSSHRIICLSQKPVCKSGWLQGFPGSHAQPQLMWPQCWSCTEQDAGQAPQGQRHSVPCTTPGFCCWQGRTQTVFLIYFKLLLDSTPI